MPLDRGRRAVDQQSSPPSTTGGPGEPLALASRRSLASGPPWCGPGELTAPPHLARQADRPGKRTAPRPTYVRLVACRCGSSRVIAEIAHHSARGQILHHSFATGPGIQWTPAGRSGIQSRPSDREACRAPTTNGFRSVTLRSQAGKRSPPRQRSGGSPPEVVPHIRISQRHLIACRPRVIFEIAPVS